GIMPFVLSNASLAEYIITYIGQQKQDDLNTYVFDVMPKTIEKGKYYFQGRIWCDDHDLMIVKSSGKSVPELHPDKKGKGEEDLKPAFTTWREQVDGHYWFPTYTRADEVLHFRKQVEDIRIR